MQDTPKKEITPENVVDFLLNLASKVEILYAQNNEPDYDAAPMFFGVNFDAEPTRVSIVPLVEETRRDLGPPEMLHLVVAAVKPDAYAFLCPGWIKSADGKERIGENLMITIETREEQTGYAYSVTRDPLPVLGPRIKMESATGRCCNLLSPPTE